MWVDSCWVVMTCEVFAFSCRWAGALKKLRAPVRANNKKYEAELDRDRSLFTAVNTFLNTSPISNFFSAGSTSK